DLLARMSLEEKIGQMTLVEVNSIRPQDITNLYLGGILSGGDGDPRQGNEPDYWSEMVNALQDYALETPLAIPIIYGVDAVHGHNNVEGAVVFPHNIGLGATRNPDLMEEIGRITALEMIATGIYWNYAPCVAVPQDIRWGRTYEGFSENTDLVTELSLAYLRGLQGDSLSDPYSVLATPKHYVGDGGAVWGTSTSNGAPIDRGVTDVDEETLREVHLAPYVAAVENGAMSIMVSFSSWDGLKMHAQEYLVTDVLKNELGFQGFIVTDWAGVDEISPNYYQAVVASINAGVDMNMVPYDYHRFIDVMFEAVDKGDISTERIDDAVRRILRAKFMMGLFEHPYGDDSLLAGVGSPEHREVGRQAVRESLVLLQNNNDALPIAKDVETIYVAGIADDIGIAAGGWTIFWQGSPGAITPGTTILEAIENTVSDTTTVEYNLNGDFDSQADVGIVVVGELPYAEFLGDKADLSLSRGHLRMIESMRQHADKVVVILLSGRPMIITDSLAMTDAFVVAWLPGTEGQGVADVLFGDFPFTGKLPYSWPRSMEQVPLSALQNDDEPPLFEFGYGLTY
ncbi:MAG: glycoside hydrolase family 3 C-terminal domain-containing protein, partial [Anaerolineae bacterium]|nr:glycoside hydrolase family 3 C-terminal domain-containing protein [Anaerolineae bacterium]